MLSGMPVSIRINGKDLRDFGIELDSLPSLMMPPVRERLYGIDGYPGSRDFGGIYDNWSFTLTGRIEGLSHRDMIAKLDRFKRWIDVQQNIMQEFVVDSGVVRALKFELAGNRFPMTDGSVLIQNGSKRIVGGVNTLSTGTNTSTSSYALVDSSATFQTDGVQVGDAVWNLTDNTATYVLSVSSETVLILADDIFTGTGKSYRVLSQPYWDFYLKPQSDLRLGGKLRPVYRITQIESGASLYVDSAVTESSAYDVSYEAERRRYLLVNYDGTSDISGLSSAHFRDRIFRFNIGFRTAYPYWIGEIFEQENQSVSAGSFIQLRGVGNAPTEPKIHIIGSATNPKVTATEVAFETQLDGNTNATDTQNESTITGTLTNQFQYGPGKLNQGIGIFGIEQDRTDTFKFSTMLDGSTPTGTIADRLDVNQGTIAVWVRPETSWHDNIHREIFYAVASNGTDYIRINKTNANNLYGYLYSSTGTDVLTAGIAINDSNFPPGVWSLIIFRWSKHETIGSTSYYAQIEIRNSTGTYTGGSTSVPAVATAPAEVYLGSAASSYPADAYFDELAIWNIPLSDSEVDSLYNSGSGARPDSVASHALLAYFDFDGTVATAVSGTALGSQGTWQLKTTSTTTTSVAVSGGGNTLFKDNDRMVLYDETGYKVEGFINGTPTSTNVSIDDGAGGAVTNADKVGVYATLDGSSQYFSGGVIHDVGTNDLALSARFKLDSAPSSNVNIVGKYDAGGSSSGYYLVITPSLQIQCTFFQGLSSKEATSSDTISVGKWYHVVALVERGTTIKLYLNGFEVNYSTQESTDTTSNVSGGTFYIGRSPYGNYFPGSVKDVRVWIAADLIGTEDPGAHALTLATDPNGSSVSFNGVSESGWWKFDEISGVDNSDYQAKFDAATGTLSVGDSVSWSAGASTGIVRNIYYATSTTGVISIELSSGSAPLNNDVITDGTNSVTLSVDAAQGAIMDLSVSNLATAPNALDMAGGTTTNYGTHSRTQLAYISKQLVADGDCENGGIGGWVYDGSAASLDSIAKSITNVKSGSRGLVIDRNATVGSVVVSKSFATGANEDYVLRWWSGGNDTSRKRVYLTDSTNTNIDGSDGANQDNQTSSWVYNERCFEAVDATTKVKLELANNSNYLGYFDFLQLLPNLVGNGGMESGGTVDVSLPTNWGQYGTPASAYKANTSSNGGTGKVHSGTYSIYVNADSYGDGVSTGITPALTVGKWYEMAAWVYVVSGTVQMFLNTSSSVAVSTSTTGQWQRISAVFQMQSGWNSTVYIRGISTTAEFYVDDVSIVERPDLDATITNQNSNYHWVASQYGKGLLSEEGVGVTYSSIPLNTKSGGFLARVEPWFDAMSSGDEKVIFEWKNSGGDSIKLSYSPSYGFQLVYSKYGGSSVTLLSNWKDFLKKQDIEISGWFDYEGRSIGGTLYYAKLFINGEEMASSTTKLPAFSSDTGTLSLGFDNSKQYSFYGVIDEVALFNRAPSDDDCVAYYTTKEEVVNTSATVTYSGSLSDNDILTIDSATGHSEVYDASTGTKSIVTLTGKSPTIFGNNDEKSVIYVPNQISGTLRFVYRPHYR